MGKSFMRLVDYVVAEVERRWQGGEQTQWELMPEALYMFENDSALSALYQRWQNAAPCGGGLPRKDAFDPQSELEQFDGVDAVECLVIRVKGDDESGASRGSRFVGSSAMLAENPKDTAFLEYELQSVLLHATPRYHHVDQITDGRQSVFSRLLLPVVGEAGDIVEVLMAENRQIETVVERA